MADINELRFDFSFRIPVDALRELELAAGDIKSPVSLMISHLLLGEGGWEMLSLKPKAELFMDNALRTIHQIPMRYIAKCRIDDSKSILHITIAVDKPLLAEWSK